MSTVNAVSKTEVDMVHVLLSRQYGQIYADIWKVGVNVPLRISELLGVKFDDLDFGDRYLHLTEKKTGEKKSIRLNAVAIEIITRRRKENPDHRWLFQVDTNRAKHKPISRFSVSWAFKGAGDNLGLSINTHSMRKSRGKAMFDAGVPVEKIAKILNHSYTTLTLRYLGIDRHGALQTYDDFEL
ncbi:MAG: tyrosine-type recombinase/integrase [Methylomonas sp.]